MSEIDDWDDVFDKDPFEEDEDQEEEQVKEEPKKESISSKKTPKNPVAQEAPFDQLTATKRSSLAKKEARAKKILAKAQEDEIDDEELEKMLRREEPHPLSIMYGEEALEKLEKEIREEYEKQEEHTVYYQEPNHNYFLVPPEVIDEINITRLRILYTPLIGYRAVELYTFFYDECHLRFQNEPNLSLTKTEILDILGLTLEEFYIAVSYLEQARLLKHILNKNDPISSIFRLVEPLSPEKFKKIPLFWHTLVLRIGGKRAKLIRGHLKETDPEYVILEQRPKRTYKARKPKLVTTPQRTLLGEFDMERSQIPQGDPPTSPSLWEDLVISPKKGVTRRSSPKKKPTAAMLFKESLYKRNYEILEANNKKILWILPAFEMNDIPPVEVTPEIERALKLIRKSYPNIDMTPQLALALLNDNEPFLHAGRLLGTPAHPNLDNCYTILLAEGFPKASLNLITDYAYSQNGVININFVVKISKNFVKQGVYDPLSIAYHLQKATLIKAQLKIRNAKRAAKFLLNSLQNEADKVHLKEEEEDEVAESYEKQYKHFDFEYEDEEELKNKKKKKVIKQILKNGKRGRRK